MSLILSVRSERESSYKATHLPVRSHSAVALLEYFYRLMEVFGAKFSHLGALPVFLRELMLALGLSKSFSSLL